MIPGKKSWVPVVMLFVVFLLPAYGQKPAYTLFTGQGEQVSYKKMVRKCARADIILFGEEHNNPIAHWLQLELLKDLYEKKGETLLAGAEMFEADNQLIMDEYFNGLITEKKFEEEMRLWNNYKTDYKPLVEFARENGIPFIATNIPRRYANSVYKFGLDTLNAFSQEAQNFMMPLPLAYDTTLSAYAALEGGGPMSGHRNVNLRDAQAVKDATMAHFILEQYRSGKTFLHFHGRYHSDHYQGIYYFLKEQDPGLSIITISTISQEKISSPEEGGEDTADFMIVVPGNMTRTY